MPTLPTLLLISPPVLSASSWNWWSSGVGSKPHLASLAGHVRDLANVRYLQLDLSVGDLADVPPVERLDALDAHLTADVGLVGISCWTSLHYLGAAAVARRIRELAPDLPIVVGGHHATAVPGDFTSDGLADWVVRGDGEVALRALCKEWPSRPDAPRVLQGEAVDPSGLAPVDWETLAIERQEGAAIWVAMSRGCPFRCAFCMEPQRGPSWSAYPVEMALQILERLARDAAPRVVCFSDPLFGADRRWTAQLLAGIEERALPMMFWAETRADLMTPELLDGFARCRFKLDFGLDTGSLAMVRQMHKSPQPERYLARSREMLRYADAIGLHHDLYLLFNHPGETPETVQETLRFVDSLDPGHPAPLSGWISGQTFFIVPGTAVYAQMDALGRDVGAEIRHPGWWREPGDHYALATDVLPSREWRGREDQLRSFHGWQARMNYMWMTRYPSEVHKFRATFHGV